jgi:hypothetical protein
MRKAIVTFSKNWWTTFVNERETPPAGAEAAAAAWAGLTPTPANATRMWQEGLAEILTHPDYVDEWVGEMASLGMSPEWEHLIR